MSTCPHCESSDRQVKVGTNRSGSQRYLCQHCRRKYTPEPKQQGYSPSVHREAVEQYVDGGNFRRIGRQLHVSHTSVMNWVNAQADRLPDQPPVPNHEPAVSELDELFTFIGAKKTKATS